MSFENGAFLESWTSSPANGDESEVYITIKEIGGWGLKILTLDADFKISEVEAVKTDFKPFDFKPATALNERFSLYGKEMSRNEFMRRSS
jgi:hypothetical protein